MRGWYSYSVSLLTRIHPAGRCRRSSASKRPGGVPPPSSTLRGLVWPEHAGGSLERWLAATSQTFGMSSQQQPRKRNTKMSRLSSRRPALPVRLTCMLGWPWRLAPTPLAVGRIALARFTQTHIASASVTWRRAAKLGRRERTTTRRDTDFFMSAPIVSL